MKYFIYLLLLFSLSTFSQTESAKRIKECNIEDGVALQGYDPVSYFSGKPLKGNKKYTTAYQGINYLFANESNKEIFKKEPAKYEPEYGGWCAYAMGENGEKVNIDPQTYKIKDGKLYVFYNRFFNNTLDKWNKDEKNYKRKADVNWSKIYKLN